MSSVDAKYRVKSPSNKKRLRQVYNLIEAKNFKKAIKLIPKGHPIPLLHFAVGHGSQEIVKHLLDGGANVDSIDEVYLYK